jgi:fatty acid desaturase
MEGFKSDIEALRKEVNKSDSVDIVHFEKLVCWQHTLFWIGYFTCWLAVNPLSIILLSTSIFARWTIVAHPVSHGSYSEVWNRRTFGVGPVNRIIHWLDYMLPEAWSVEHNQHHHYSLGEDADPDQVERNLNWLRTSGMPRPFKYIVCLFLALSWKWIYYADNILTIRQAKGIPHGWWNLFFVLAPFFIWRFLLLPLPFVFIGASYNVLVSMVLAEILTNLHAFVVIVPNHTGDDVYRFTVPCVARSEEFYRRQVLGSVNYHTGGQINDFLHGYLNYQIEHHLFPEMSLLALSKLQPKVREICIKHNVPYVQQSVWKRVKKTVDIMVGNTSMPSTSSARNVKARS